MHATKEICDQLTDIEIVNKSLVDIDFFSCLYDRYEPKLIRYINRITSLSDEETEDILQDSFIKIWRNLNDFDPSMKLSSWIYRIVHNQTISYWRKKNSYGKNQQIPIDDQIEKIATEDDIETLLEKENKEQTIRNLLELLPVKYKTVLVLKFMENMSYEEISDVLKIPEGTVGTRINRAKKAFAKIAKEKTFQY